MYIYIYIYKYICTVISRPLRHSSLSHSICITFFTCVTCFTRFTCRTRRKHQGFSWHVVPSLLLHSDFYVCITYCTYLFCGFYYSKQDTTMSLHIASCYTCFTCLVFHQAQRYGNVVSPKKKSMSCRISSSASGILFLL